MLIDIALDAVGSDKAPEPEIRGAILACRTLPVRVHMIGPEPELRDLLIAIRSEIERIDKASPEAWRRVAHMIQMRKPPSHSLSELDPVNKRAI